MKIIGALVLVMPLLAPSELPAMDFEQITWRGHQVLKATGEIVQGDEVRLAESLLNLKPLSHGLPCNEDGIDTVSEDGGDATHRIAIAL
jgi:hypothetical protein